MPGLSDAVSAARPASEMPRKRDERHWIKINRAPVLTLWAAVVAERLGFSSDEALTLGRAVAGLNAYAKGVRLGLFQPTPQEVRKKRRALRKAETISVDLLNRAVPAVHTDQGLCAVSKKKPIRPESVSKYLEGKFGGALDDAHSAMTVLAKSMRPSDLAGQAYKLYEEFRPEVPSGAKGWGAVGRLSLDKIREMAGKKRPDHS